MKIVNPWCKFEWNEEKNESLKKERGVSFEMVEAAWFNNEEVHVVKHHNQRLYSHQGELLLKLKGYVYSVPFVQTGSVLFLKTMFPSRKAKKIF